MVTKVGLKRFPKWTISLKEAVIATFDDPRVFSDITVRNDQDINLFSGSLDSVDNSLNQNRQQLLQAEFDLPKGGAVPLPAINMINSIEVKRSFDLPFESPPPLDQTDSIFERDVAPFERGELRWVQVQIPIDDMEMVGDEVVLKQPTLLYPSIDDAAEQVFENVGENETDRIAEQIERSPAAEPGYWYRIFKAYQNRDDELIFYYYKTGEVDTVPAESAEGEEPLPVEESPEKNNDDEILEPDASEPEPATGGNHFSNYSADPSNDNFQSFAASSLLLGLLRRESKRNLPAGKSSSNVDATIGDTTIDDENLSQTTSTDSYDRLSRLKRKLKRCL